MFAIIGAAGNVGLHTCAALRKAGKPVRAILRSNAKQHQLEALGCDITVANVQDTHALANAMKNAHSVQVIIPLSPQAADPAADMRHSIDSIIEVLRQVRPQRILAISDYGAHIPHDIGMPSIFHYLESELASLDGHKIVLRSAEHMHNWAQAVAVALESGQLPTFQNPADMLQPTIAAQDLGVIAAELLMAPMQGNGLEVVHAEGPARYSAEDIAQVLGELAGRHIQAQVVPRSQWRATLEGVMPVSLATLLIKAADAKNEGGVVDVEYGVGTVCYGSTTMNEALSWPRVDGVEG